MFKKKKLNHISKTHTEVCWSRCSPSRDAQNQREGRSCTTSVPSAWRRALAKHFCVYRIARAHLQCMLSLRSFHGGTDFPHMSPVQTVRSPLPSTQIKRRSPNETQMWNVSAQLDLRQLGLRGRLFPESHNIHETISITPLWPESAKRCRLDWKERQHAFKCLL